MQHFLKDCLQVYFIILHIRRRQPNCYHCQGRHSVSEHSIQLWIMVEGSAWGERLCKVHLLIILMIKLRINNSGECIRILMKRLTLTSTSRRENRNGTSSSSTTKLQDSDNFHYPFLTSHLRTAHQSQVLNRCRLDAPFLPPRRNIGVRK